ncbi:hypothetical protein [Streptomyces huasconensis]|uniref:hypothetical protein n=1 Tax=Streptomyces huasconensis TaxID=1854574 RepID=UPI0033F66192
MAATALAAAHPDATAQAGSGERVFVEASTIPVEELIGLNSPQPPSDYSRHSAQSKPQQPAAAPDAGEPDAGEPADLRKECADRAEKAKAAKRWIKSRFESCQKRPHDLVLRGKQGTQSIGRLWFDQWILSFAYDGSRRVDYISSIENIRVQATPNDAANKWRVGQHFSHTSNAGSSDPNPAVTAPQSTSRDELLGVRDRTPQWMLTYTSPDKGAFDSKDE